MVIVDGQPVNQWLYSFYWDRSKFAHQNQCKGNFGGASLEALLILRASYYWLVVLNINFIFPYIRNVTIPTDEFIFFRGVGIPPTSNPIIFADFVFDYPFASRVVARYLVHARYTQCILMSWLCLGPLAESPTRQLRMFAGITRS